MQHDTESNFSLRYTPHLNVLAFLVLVGVQYRDIHLRTILLNQRIRFFLKLLVLKSSSKPSLFKMKSCFLKNIVRICAS
jgi:hypothetical protein